MTDLSDPQVFARTLLDALLRVEEGVSAGYAADAGAQVVPVQVSVHADTTVADTEGGAS